MSFASEASKLLTNKYFLYFIVFLAASNVLGYLVSNKINAVIFFALVAFLVSNFSKNMSVILLVAIIYLCKKVFISFTYYWSSNIINLLFGLPTLSSNQLLEFI